MKIACISDTHKPLHDLEWPEADLLIHAGDLTMMGTPLQLIASLEWLASAPYARKMFVWGNHDLETQKQQDVWRHHARSLDLELLMPWEVHEFGGLKFTGSPYSSRIWGVWQLDRGEPARVHWGAIPPEADVLVTHGPPHGILDEVPGAFDGPDDDGHVGDRHLRDAVFRRDGLKLHVFGHIHEGHGVETKLISGRTRTFINAATLGRDYREMRPPIVVEVNIERS